MPGSSAWRIPATPSEEPTASGARGIMARMAAPTGFLYGDSTPSPLKSDFIAFLRDAFDFAVEVLRSDARMADAVLRVTKLSDATEREIELAEELATDVARALEGVSTRAPGSLAARCAARIQQGARELVSSEADAARTTVVEERARLAKTASTEYEACTKAFEALVLRHTLPDAMGVTIVKLEDGGRYDALLQCHTPYGLEWTVELDVPSTHALSHVLRVDRVVERLEVEAPEEGGWLHKEIRNRPQRLDRLHLTGLSVHPAETAVRLRAGADGGGAGFDLLFRSDPAHVELLRIVEGGAGAESPFKVVGDDAAKLEALREILVTMVGELGEHKKALRQASLGGTPLQKLESPRAVVEKLVANIAPTVHEIARRSLAPGELVLKRLLGDNHREEVFVSKKELEQKIEPLPSELRAAFDELKLWNGAASARPAARASAPPHAAPAAPTTKTVSSAPIQIISPPPAAAAPIPPAPVPSVIVSDSDRPPKPQG